MLPVTAMLAKPVLDFGGTALGGRYVSKKMRREAELALKKAYHCGKKFDRYTVKQAEKLARYLSDLSGVNEHTTASFVSSLERIGDFAGSKGLKDMTSTLTQLGQELLSSNVISSGQKAAASITFWAPWLAIANIGSCAASCVTAYYSYYLYHSNWKQEKLLEGISQELKKLGADQKELKGILEGQFKFFQEKFSVKSQDQQEVRRELMVRLKKESANPADILSHLEEFQDSTDPEILFKFGLASLRTGSYISALAYFNAARLHGNLGYELYFIRGLTYFRLQEYELAAQDFELIYRDNQNSKIIKKWLDMAKRKSPKIPADEMKGEFKELKNFDAFVKESSFEISSVFEWLYNPNAQEQKFISMDTDRFLDVEKKLLENKPLMTQEETETQEYLPLLKKIDSVEHPDSKESKEVLGEKSVEEKALELADELFGKNDALAIRFLKKVAEGSHSTVAMECLGDYFLRSYDADAMLSWYLKASEGGNVSAQNKLAHLLMVRPDRDDHIDYAATKEWLKEYFGLKNSNERIPYDMHKLAEYCRLLGRFRKIYGKKELDKNQLAAWHQEVSTKELPSDLIELFHCLYHYATRQSDNIEPHRDYLLKHPVKGPAAPIWKYYLALSYPSNSKDRERHFKELYFLLYPKKCVNNDIETTLKNFGHKLLAAAIINGHVFETEILLNIGIGPIRSVLFGAIRTGQLSIVRYLLHEYIGPGSFTLLKEKYEGLCPLAYAVKTKQYEIVKFLLEECDAGLSDENKMEAFLLALETKQENMIELFWKTYNPDETVKSILHALRDCNNPLAIFEKIRKQGDVFSRCFLYHKLLAAIKEKGDFENSALVQIGLEICYELKNVGVGLIAHYFAGVPQLVQLIIGIYGQLYFSFTNQSYKEYEIRISSGIGQELYAPTPLSNVIDFALWMTSASVISVLMRDEATESDDESSEEEDKPKSSTNRNNQSGKKKEPDAKCQFLLNPGKDSGYVQISSKAHQNEILKQGLRGNLVSSSGHDGTHIVLKLKKKNNEYFVVMSADPRGQNVFAMNRGGLVTMVNGSQLDDHALWEMKPVGDVLVNRNSATDQYVITRLNALIPDCAYAAKPEDSYSTLFSRMYGMSVSKSANIGKKGEKHDRSEDTVASSDQSEDQATKRTRFTPSSTHAASLSSVCFFPAPSAPSPSFNSGSQPSADANKKKSKLQTSCSDSQQKEKRQKSNQRTKGDGDCAFHAILGQWNENNGQYECSNVTDRRRALASFIQENKSNANVSSAVKEALQQMIMSDMKVRGHFIDLIKTLYQQFLLDNETKIQQEWNRFETILRRHQVILEYIGSDAQVASQSLRTKFQAALNKEDGLLYGLILSIEELAVAFRRYNEASNQSFNWDQRLSGEGVIGDYIQFLQQPRSWLLPCELSLIAQAFQTRVEFFTTDPDTHKSRFVATYNPQVTQTVSVCFNGRNHYERLDFPRQNADAAVFPVSSPS